MNVVAHQDDDLLFMNPDLLHHIAAGHCVRTIYMTAGDAGQNSQYWLGRERGSQAAYASLLGIDKKELWVQRTIKLADHEFITVVNPRGNRRISLVFMRLADGNINGKGFGASHHESLASLISNKLPRIQAVDSQSYYTSDQLTGALSLLMKTYQPTEVNTQATTDLGRVFHDHSDHTTAGQYTQRAHQAYMVQATPVPIHFFVGYPIRGKPENISGEDLRRKEDAFMAYGQFDNGVCHSIAVCERIPTYWSYLHRQYTTEQWTSGPSTNQ
jgi:LmbE family N-acetylglucosaminyl deacetylase